MTTIFLDSLWPGLATWAALYVSDYCLTIYCARLYRTRARGRICFEGSFELTPMFQKDVDAGRRFSPRFLIVLVASGAWLGMAWLLSNLPPVNLEIYEFALGMLVLVELAVHHRHIRNAVFFRTGFGDDGVRGRIEYPRPLILRNSAAELLCFAGLYLAVFAVTGSPFLLGGATLTLATGLGHLRLARKAAMNRRAALGPADGA
jgi:hypothetical protein